MTCLNTPCVPVIKHQIFQTLPCPLAVWSGISMSLDSELLPIRVETSLRNVVRLLKQEDALDKIETVVLPADADDDVLNGFVCSSPAITDSLKAALEILLQYSRSAKALKSIAASLKVDGHLATIDHLFADGDLASQNTAIDQTKMGSEWNLVYHIVLPEKSTPVRQDTIVDSLVCSVRRELVGLGRAHGLQDIWREMYSRVMPFARIPDNLTQMQRDIAHWARQSMLAHVSDDSPARSGPASSISKCTVRRLPPGLEIGLIVDLAMTQNPYHKLNGSDILAPKPIAPPASGNGSSIPESPESSVSVVSLTEKSSELIPMLVEEAVMPSSKSSDFSMPKLKRAIPGEIAGNGAVSPAALFKPTNRVSAPLNSQGRVLSGLTADYAFVFSELWPGKLLNSREDVVLQLLDQARHALKAQRMQIGPLREWQYLCRKLYPGKAPPEEIEWCKIEVLAYREMVQKQDRGAWDEDVHNSSPVADKETDSYNDSSIRREALAEETESPGASICDMRRDGRSDHSSAEVDVKSNDTRAVGGSIHDSTDEAQKIAAKVRAFTTKNEQAQAALIHRHLYPNEAVPKSRETVRSRLRKTYVDLAEYLRVREQVKLLWRAPCGTKSYDERLSLEQKLMAQVPRYKTEQDLKRAIKEGKLVCPKWNKVRDTGCGVLLRSFEF